MTRFGQWLLSMLLQRSPEPPPPGPDPVPGLDRLYVLRVDFPMTAEKHGQIYSALEPLRTKYGIDFFVIEPGVQLSRFDDL